MPPMTPSAFSASTELLQTSRFVLRPIRPADVPDLYRHFSDPRVVEYMDIEALVSQEEAHGIVNWTAQLREEGKGVRWTLRSKEDESRFLGTIGLNSITYERGRRGEIAYDLSPGCWGQGIMAEAGATVLNFAETSLHLRRVEAMVTPGNERSTALLRKLGFEKEGRLRHYAFWKGRFWDQLLFSRIFPGVS